MKTALLMLEDGNRFYGQSIGACGESIGEIVFNTAMTGYQEIITDPSYTNQIIVLTYPHIGNVGVNEFDKESTHIRIAGLVIRNSTIISSNFRCTMSLSNYLIEHNIIGISDVDTRKLTRLIRNTGIQHACIMAHKKLDVELALYKARNFPESYKLNLAYKISTSEKYIWRQGTIGNIRFNNSLLMTTKKLCYNVVVYDFGVKYNIMRMLVDYGCLLTVVPAKTTAKEVIDMKPDGIFLSNGPGDPNEYYDVIYEIQFFLSKTNIPIFGICLGHQLLAMANGAKTVRMKFGHHGSNHPVKDIENNKIMITTQNHNYTVDMLTLPNILKVTHISLFDGTLQGIKCINSPSFGFQGHPEASPGPHDTSYIFMRFIELIKNYQNSRTK